MTLTTNLFHYVLVVASNLLILSGTLLYTMLCIYAALLLATMYFEIRIWFMEYKKKQLTNQLTQQDYEN